MNRTVQHRATRFAATLVAAIACADLTTTFAQDAPTAAGSDESIGSIEPATSEPTASAEANAAEIVTAVEVDPFVLAGEQFRAAQWTKAIDTLRQALVAHADDERAPAARFYLAEALLHANRHGEAAAAYRDCLREELADALQATAQFRLSEALFLAGDMATARTAAETFLATNPHHAFAPQARFYCGEACRALGDYHAAEASLAYITAAHADDALAPRAALLQAACLLELNQPRAAWTVLAPQLVDAAQGDVALAEALAGNALAALADEHAVTAADDDAQLDAAESRFAELLSSLPQHAAAPYAAFRLAQIGAERGDWQTAADHFTAAIEHPDLDAELAPQAWLGRAQAAAQLRRWDDVIDAATTAAERFPTWSRQYEFAYLRGRAHVGRAELDAAREAFALVTASQDAVGTETAVLARFMTAETYLLQRAYEPALAEYLRVVELDVSPWQASALLQCGKCREQLGRPHEARRDYARLLAEFPEASCAAEASRRQESASQHAAQPNSPQRQ